LKRVGRNIGRLLWCSAGAATALTLALFLTHLPDHSRWLMASLGGSTVFLFGLTRTAAAQPRALFGGHLGGALMGIICYGAFGDAVWVYALAVVLTLVFMLVTRTVHPPPGRTPSSWCMPTPVSLRYGNPWR
jgi:CBS-domain-containing membrane protein